MPLPTTLHLEYVKAALNAGKHVLVEKPVSTTVEEYKEMIDVAKKNGKYLMDGTMFVHNPRTRDIIASLSGDNYISRIQSDFTFAGNQDFFRNNVRISANGDVLGCIGDLGWYCIRMALLVFQCPAVSAQVVHAEVTSDGVPIDATCVVTFQSTKKKDDDDGHIGRTKILSFHCSFLHPLNQSVTMFGTQRSIHVDDFVIPRKVGGSTTTKLGFHENSQSLSFADLFSIHIHEWKESTKNFNDVPQEVLMWSNFVKYCKCVDGKVDDPNSVSEGNKIMEISLANQCIVNALMESLRKGGEKVMI